MNLRPFGAFLALAAFVLAAFKRFGGPCIIADCGTATVFDAAVCDSTSAPHSVLPISTLPSVQQVLRFDGIDFTKR